MKGVEVCEKLGGARQTGIDPEMPELAYTEYIGIRGEPRELKHLSTWWKRKKNRLPSVAASESGIAQTERVSFSGL
jgi:hypothetical protein